VFGERLLPAQVLTQKHKTDASNEFVERRLNGIDNEIALVREGAYSRRIAMHGCMRYSRACPPVPTRSKTDRDRERCVACSASSPGAQLRAAVGKDDAERSQIMNALESVRPHT
jgi:hypothetical protein